MTRFRSLTVVTLLLAFLSVGMLLPMTARASEDGRRNTTIGFGAATAYFLARKQWVPAAVAGVGTVVAQHNWQAAINARHRRAHRLALQRSYRMGYRRGYSVRRRLALSRSYRSRHRY